MNKKEEIIVSTPKELLKAVKGNKNKVIVLNERETIRADKSREARWIALNKSFHICSVCREDIVYALTNKSGTTQAQAERKALKITDSEMERLASKMSDAFGDTGVYQEALKIWLEEILDG